MATDRHWLQGAFLYRVGCCGLGCARDVLRRSRTRRASVNHSLVAHPSLVISSTALLLCQGDQAQGTLVRIHSLLPLESQSTNPYPPIGGIDSLLRMAHCAPPRLGGSWISLEFPHTRIMRGRVCAKCN